MSSSKMMGQGIWLFGGGDFIDGLFATQGLRRKNGYAHTQGQACYIDERVHFAIAEVALGGFEIVLPHDWPILVQSSSQFSCQ